MIERVYIKDYLTFDEVDIEFSKGLNVFTGPSGAGKSVLIRGILSIFGFFDGVAKISEAVVNNPLSLEKYGIEEEDIIVFRQVKKHKNRYFINRQVVSKKTLQEIVKEFVDYLSLREVKDFESKNILEILDKMIKEKEYYVKLEEYKNKFKKYQQIKQKLKKIEENEKNLIDKKEFLKFEIGKIKSINPKENEFEELMEIKRDLSKIEKIKEKVIEVSEIFNFENRVYELLDMLGEDNEFFSNSMNELRIIIDKAEEKAEYLENIDIEEILDRLSQLQELIRRFSSIENSLEYLKEKEKELEELENISFEKADLEIKLKELENELKELGEYIHLKRVEISKKFIDNLNSFLEKLYMPKASIKIEKVSFNEIGINKAEIIINNIDINTISTGEFNRLRLAMLGAKLEYSNDEKVLFLDEIDANLSGEESMSVAEILKLLSQKYQIFAISHQPQLASVADKHFFVTKQNNKSFIEELNIDKRVEEIARIIGGKDKSKKAIEYAKELLKGEND